MVKVIALDGDVKCGREIKNYSQLFMIKSKV